MTQKESRASGDTEGAANTKLDPDKDYRADHSKSSDRSRIERHILGQISPIKKKSGSNFDWDLKRRSEIEKIIQRRHAGQVPDTDDADIYFDPMGRTIAATFEDESDQRSFMVEWLSKVAPWLDDVHKEAERHVPMPGCPVSHLTAVALGRQLRLTYAERKAFGITTISPFDKTPEEMKDLKKERDKVAKAAARLAKGCTPRSKSLSQTKPWEGKFCRRTLERHRKKARDATAAQYEKPAENGDVAETARYKNEAETLTDANTAQYENSSVANSSAPLTGSSDSTSSLLNLGSDAIATTVTEGGGLMPPATDNTQPLPERSPEPAIDVAVGTARAARRVIARDCDNRPMNTYQAAKEGWL